MKHADPVALRGASKALIPVIALLAIAMIATGVSGAGLAGGALLSISVLLHALIYGSDASRRAMPAWGWRLCLFGALILCAISASSPDWPFAAPMAEAGVAVACVSAVALAFSALAGRAPALRDEEW